MIESLGGVGERMTCVELCMLEKEEPDLLERGDCAPSVREEVDEEEVRMLLQSCEEMRRVEENGVIDALIAAVNQGEQRMFEVMLGSDTRSMMLEKLGSGGEVSVRALEVLSHAITLCPQLGEVLCCEGLLEVLEPMKGIAGCYRTLASVYVELLQEGKREMFLSVMDQCIGHAIVVLMDEKCEREIAMAALDVITTVFDQVYERKLEIEFLHVNELGAGISRMISGEDAEMSREIVKCLTALLRGTNSADVIASYEIFGPMWQIARTDVAFCRKLLVLLSLVVVVDRPERRETLEDFIDWDFLLSQTLLVELHSVWCMIMVQLTSQPSQKLLAILFSKNIMDLLSWVFDQSGFGEIICASGVIKNMLFGATSEQARCILSHQATEKMLLFLKEFDHNMTAYIIGAILRVIKSESSRSLVDSLREKWASTGVIQYLEDICDSDIAEVAESASLLYEILTDYE